MHGTTLIRQIVLGLVLGSILLAPTPAVRAQWAVHDHPNMGAEVQGDGR